MPTPNTPQGEQFDRSACHAPQRSCTCHDSELPNWLKPGETCRVCSCRRLPRIAPAARAAGDDPEASPPPSAQGASVERVMREALDEIADAISDLAFDDREGASHKVDRIRALARRLPT